MPPAIIAAVIAGGSSIGGSLLSRNRSGSSSTTTPNRDEHQAAIQAQIARIVEQALSSGPGVPQWMKNAGRKEINTAHASVLPKFEQMFASRGFERSGKVGQIARDNEFSRINDLSEMRSKLSEYGDQNYRQMLELAFRFQQPQGQTSTGTQTGPSNLGSSIAGIGGDIGSMYWLQHLIGGGGGPNLQSGGSGGYGISGDD